GNGRRTVSTLANLGDCLVQLGRPADAEVLLRDCLKAREKNEPDAWTTFSTRSLLGGALLAQKKYADAEPLLLAGYEGMKEREAKMPAAAKSRLIEALDRLVQVCEAAGKPDEATKWKKELDALKAASTPTAKP